jgi:hypothetical protein
MPSVLVGNRDGLLWFEADGRGGETAHRARRVSAVVPERDALWAIVDETEIWHSADRKAWTPAGDLGSVGPLRGRCVAATDAGVFVGSSEARLFRVAPDGGGLEPVGGFDAAEGRSSWYTPWGGPPDTRSIAEWDEAVYVNVHVGGILRTTDGGAGWTPTIDVDEDVHQVTTAEGLVLAACAGGLAVSEDRGDSWSLRTDGLAARYCRGVVVCGDTVLVSASQGPRGGRAGVYRGDLSGGGFERCRGGLPEWFDDNIDTHCLDGPPDGSLVAFGTSDGRVFVSDDAGASWKEIASGLSPVECVLVLP